MLRQPFDLIGVDLIAGKQALELLEAVNNAKNQCFQLITKIWTFSHHVKMILSKWNLEK